MFKYVCGGLIAMMPLALSFYYFYTLFRSLMHCKVAVEAEIIKISVIGSTDSEGNHTTYSNPTFRYHYDGKEYISSEKGGYVGLMYQKGDIITLHINPEDPYDILDKKRRIKPYLQAGTISLLMGIVMMTLVLFFACHQS